MDYQAIATIHPAAKFDVEKNTGAIRAAMKGLGTDEEALIDILTRLSNDQRQKLKEHFNASLNRDLIADLKSETSGNFKATLKALMMPPLEYLCKRMHDGMKYVSRNPAENVLVECLLPRTNEEIIKIKSTYHKMYNTSLSEHICEFTRIADMQLVLQKLLEAKREALQSVNDTKAKEQAQELLALGQASLNPKDEVFASILAYTAFAQLRSVFKHYADLSGHSIQQAIKRGVEAHADVVLSIVECVQSPPTFFANRLFKAMDGAGTDDTTLIRIIVSRSEIDLGNIKEEFERLYNRTLLSAVKSETSGDYKRALCAIIGEA